MAKAKDQARGQYVITLLAENGTQIGRWVYVKSYTWDTNKRFLTLITHGDMSMCLHYGETQAIIIKS